MGVYAARLTAERERGCVKKKKKKKKRQKFLN